MMDALVEYKKMVMDPSNRWLVKHWKGYTVFCVALIGIGYAIENADSIRNFIEEKFNRKEKEES